MLRTLLAGLPGGVLDEPNEEGWSIKDIVAHLLDVEGVAFFERMGGMLHEERPFMASIDPPARLVAGGYAARTLDELLNELERQRVEHVAWLGALTAAELERVGEHDRLGEIRVVDIAHRWPAHDLTHLRQIALMVQQYLAPLIGVPRSFYDV